MAKTIEDYKKDYELAKAAGDAAGMKAANDAANALREAQGEQAQYATTAIAEVAAKSYTPVNATSAAGIDYDNYLDEVAKQQAYIAANSSAAQSMSEQEKQDKYGDIMDATAESGYYTKDYAAALAAAQQYGVTVTPTIYNGESGWYYVPKAQRTVQEGTSGADEGLLSDDDYAIIQSLKSQFTAAQQGYKAALAAGDTELAAQYQAAMDEAHLEAERIRAGYGYSGGSDGSMYITSGALGTAGSGYDEGYDDLYSGGTASAGSSLSVPQGNSLSGYVEDYSAYLKQMNAASKASALAELKAAYEKNLAALDRAGTGIAEQYQAARNLSAGSSAVSGRNFAEYAAAAGLNNGTAGQAELARSVTLQNNLNGINTAEADTVADLQLARANAEIEYNNAIAQAEATGDYQTASALYQEKVRVQEALIELELQEQQDALKRYQLEYQAQQDAISNQLAADKFAFQQQQYADSLSQSQNSALAAYGEAYLKLGIMPSSAMLAAMGISSEDAQRYIAAMGK